MSYLIEFQRQQKAMKDAERDRKKNASSMLNKYRGSEQDIKNDIQLKALKDADRDNKKKASSMLNQYRGGEHDIKNDTQLKALKDADRDNKKKASSLLNQYRGGDDDIKLKNDTQLKAIRDADRDNKKNASKLLHSYHGGEHDVKDYERAVIADRKETSMRSAHRSSLVVPDTKIDPEGSESAVVEAISTALAETEIVEEEEVEIVEEEIIEEVVEEEVPEEPRSKGKALGNYEQHLSNSPGANSKKTKAIAGKSRKALSIEFSFGIILMDDEPYPDVELCESAASVIVPHVISQWTHETNIFCNPKAPKVADEIVTDDWYDGEDDTRYKVKGSVPVQVFAESSAQEVSEGLGKVLRRRVSFRPVYEGEKVSPQETVIGDGDQKWMRVRDGRLGGLGITF